MQNEEIIDFVKDRIKSLEISINRIELKAGLSSENNTDSQINQDVYNSQKGQLLEAYKILSFLQND